MKLTAQEEARLERLIGAVCRELPPLAAPRALAARVAHELQRRAARPAWRASFSYWPFGLRVAFVLLGLGLMELTLAPRTWSGTQRLAAQLLAPFSRSLARLEHAAAAIDLLGGLCRELGAALLQGIPTVWLYGAIALVLALYALLAGISATAYRTLHSTR